MNERIADRLRSSGQRATKGRVALLGILERSPSPLSISDIVEDAANVLDQANLYRSLEALERVGLVRRVDVGHSHAHYEAYDPTRHHHHLICRACGKVEDVPDCDVSAIEEVALRGSEHFSEIIGHSLEFYGICDACRGPNQR